MENTVEETFQDGCLRIRKGLEQADIEALLAVLSENMCLAMKGELGECDLLRLLQLNKKSVSVCSINPNMKFSNRYHFRFSRCALE